MCRAWIVILGWSLFAFITYKTAGAKMENVVYDPFEILGLSAVSIYSRSFSFVYGRRDEWHVLNVCFGQGVTEKEIKSHFKKLSKKL